MAETSERTFSCFYISLWWTWIYFWRNCSSQDYWTLVNYRSYNLQDITNGEKVGFFFATNVKHNPTPRVN